MAVFPSTHWTSVARIRQADAGVRRNLVEAFLTTYATPMRTHITVQFPLIQPNDAEDLLQEFIASHFLQKSILDRADRQRGRLRSLLRVSLNNHIKTWLAKRRRDPLQRMSSLQGDAQAETQNLDAGFDLAWSRFVMVEAICRFKDDCNRNNHQILWDTFDLRLLRPAMLGTESIPYQQLADRYGTSTRQLENLLTTAKRQFGRILRDIVSTYTASPEETEEEIRELRNITSQIKIDLPLDVEAHA